MGFNNTSHTRTLTAKLTPFGRKALVSNNNFLITSFSLGDSDANYYATLPLTTGEIPAESGEIGPNASISNSTTQNVTIKSVLVVSGNGVLTKPLEKQSTQIISTIIHNGQVTISGTNISYNVINRNNFETDSLVNLYYSFGLPLTTVQDINFTGVSFENGGYSSTTLSGLAKSNILVIGLKNTTYGESLDGKQIRLNLSTTAGTFTIYSTFQNKGARLVSEDANFRDTSTITRFIGDNIALLFSDDILPPNGGVGGLSWGTGFGSKLPFSQGQKQLYNLTTTPSLGKSADTMVGVAYLDKGFLVITEPSIVNAFVSSATTATTIVFNSISTQVSQSITCIANRGEFGTSTNPSFNNTSVPRISEVGLYDRTGNLIALAKPDRHITKNVNDFLALSINFIL